MEVVPRKAPLSSVERLLGDRRPSKENSKVVRRPGALSRAHSTSQVPRRRHSMDDRVRPHAYTGKIFGAVSLGGNRTYDDFDMPGRSASKRSVDLPKLSGSDERPQASVKPAAADSSDALACQLALKNRLMLSEVKRIIREFINVKHNETGGVDREDFNRALANIFDVSAVNDRVSASAYKATNASVEIDIENFLAWYVQNMFTQVNALNASPEKSASDQLIYQLAEKHEVSNFVVDKIKVKFDHFDTNKNGRICFQEFQDMFCAILKSRNIGELNEHRIHRFWSQIHKESAEGADFTEFAEWYLKYFSADTDDEDWDMLGPLRKFYDSFDPTVQRRNSLKGLSRVASMPGNM